MSASVPERTDFRFVPFFDVYFRLKKVSNNLHISKLFILSLSLSHIYILLRDRHLRAPRYTFSIDGQSDGRIYFHRLGHHGQLPGISTFNISKCVVPYGGIRTWLGHLPVCRHVFLSNS